MGEIVFNRPHATGREFDHIAEAIAGGHLSGAGPFSKRCAEWLCERTGCAGALLTTSCTAALELAVLLAGIGPGDEVIMPSFTFVSGANAVALRGAVPVFAEIRADTLNLDPERLELALGPRTKAIMPTHYAGVGADMDAIVSFARERDLVVIEDAAQGLMASYRGRSLGTMGQLGAISFHETKNVTCGEGGALLINEQSWIERAEIAYEKGTNRSQFFRGAVDRYTWVDLGSSFLASDLNAAFLWGQLEEADAITARRLEIWRRYHDAFAELETRGLVRRPIVPDDCRHNAHAYYLLLGDSARRDALIAALGKRGVMAVFHYVPLHSSPAGMRFGRAAGDLALTDEVSGRLVRLPVWVGMSDDDVDRVASEVERALT
jgi:dTDP-4-amino-4,6-dideoxygalactose transaminase